MNMSPSLVIRFGIPLGLLLATFACYDEIQLDAGK